MSNVVASVVTRRGSVVAWILDNFRFHWFVSLCAIVCLCMTEHDACNEKGTAFILSVPSALAFTALTGLYHQPQRSRMVSAAEDITSTACVSV